MSPVKGGYFSEEALKKIRENHWSKRKSLSEETRRKISATNKGQIPWNKGGTSWNKGKSLSEETRRKMSKARKGRIPWNKGKPPSEETKRKLSISTSKAIQEGRCPGPKSRGKSGDFYSPKNRQWVHYRSKLELKMYHLLEIMSQVKRYHVEPIHIPYVINGKWRTYIPDLRVRYTDGTTDLIEIKPQHLKDDPVNQAKWKAARKWCKGRSVPTKFRVWTEVRIDQKATGS